jgi:putative intracellular protease/amidase
MDHSRLGRLLAQLLVLATAGLCACAPANRVVSSRTEPASLPKYVSRLGHGRPVIAIVANNRGAELSDLLVPFGILSRDEGLDIRVVATSDGALSTFTDMGQPGPRIQGQSTLHGFDEQVPEGADYVVVPAQASSQALIDWLKSQAGKGATVVSVCNGGLIVAQTGLFAGRFATAHWSTESARIKSYPSVRWVRDRRYLADGPWISTSGVSAAVPVSIALIEAIHGRAKAARIARDLGVDDWSSVHDTSAFEPHLSGTAWPLTKVAYTNRWWHKQDPIVIPVSDSIDEVSLALTADAYSSTGRSRAFVTTADGRPVVTRHGLTLWPDSLPQRIAGSPVIPPTERTGATLDGALDGIMQRYGQATADGVALVFEFPWKRSR